MFARRAELSAAWINDSEINEIANVATIPIAKEANNTLDLSFNSNPYSERLVWSALTYISWEVAQIIPPVRNKFCMIQNTQ